MANPEHLRLLDDWEAWLEWRGAHPEITPDLSFADLRTIRKVGTRDLSHCNLRGANLSGLKINGDGPDGSLVGADLTDADLTGTHIFLSSYSGATLSEKTRMAQIVVTEARLRNVRHTGVGMAYASFSNCRFLNVAFVGANLNNSYFELCDLSAVDFSEASIRGSRFVNADEDSKGTIFKSAKLEGSSMREQRFPGADFSRADLTDVDFTGSRLQGASFRDANLAGTNLSRCSLEEADFTGAVLGNTLLCQLDLSSVRGLESCHHVRESSIDVATFRRSGELPRSFLEGLGLSDNEIDYAPTLDRHAIEFFSCFICYSTVDEVFAERLYSDLKSAGARCWIWKYDPRTGRKTMSEIDQAIAVHDKLVLIASQSALESPAVLREVERALQKEDSLKRTGAGDTDVLFPVCLDDYVFESWEHERKADVLATTIADARRWRDETEYQRILLKLKDDLVAGTRRQSGQGGTT